ncbi:hypothetical protein CQW23_14985 [Capsicum baccatum]|uniref:Uncharacterized protein n=1 Tax=Capsicum baccatum TaxID=33114 RepID=A0A2G2WKR4_CAPBA|nr:hypothetical protein CQW23_14985 [Capsicum baccatum]
MADGFLNLQNELEGEAEKCLQDLIDRCLVLFGEKSLDETKISTCYVHDLIYDLFLREVQRGNIFTTNDIVFDNSDANHDRSKCQSLSRHKLHPFKSFTGDEIHDFPYGFYSTCQLRDTGNNDLLKRTHSIRISGGYFSTLILKSVLIHFKLLKLLDLSHMRIVSFPLQIVSLIWLRYLELHCGKNFDIPPEICRLWNLQTFIVEGNRQTDMQTFIVERIRRSVITFPKEIWGLMQLRHLKVDRFILPNPPSVSVDRVRHLDFSNIQTISYLSPHCCTKEVISEIQNVKKLGIYGNRDDYKMIIPSAKSFPATLKKLKLKSTYLSWLYLDIIAELPNLEVLELMDYACCGKEWHPFVRGFTRLKLLLIEENDLRYWKATDDNFPVLERLVLKECSYLKEMPIEFADIHSLQLIMLTSCLPERGESAARIQKEQEEIGNNPVDVRISNQGHNWNTIDMAYASVASLMRTIQSVLISNSPTLFNLICGHREEIVTLHEKVSSLGVFLKNFEKNNVSGEMMDFEVEVNEVANVVEYTFQLRLTDIEMAKNISQNKRARQKFRHSLQQVAADIDRVWKESTKIQDKGKQASKESLVQDFSSSANDTLNVKNDMVGRDDQRKQLLELMTIGYSREHKVIPIIGMGALEILVSLLHSTKGDTFDMVDKAKIADMLQKSLKSKRYLIVLDDIWSCEVWDDVRRCFPTENNTGSRILLTTRNNEVACYAGTENLSLQMDFMDQDESRNLFKSAAFANEELPSEFETIGKQIAEKCHGLPLTIVVVAGLLKSKRTIEDWESVAKDVKSFVTNDPDERCSYVLGLSYNNLTSNLKSCLLYFGIFREDTEIPVKNLMRLWMAEGFLNSENDLEGEAMKCLQDLIDRCLVLVGKKSLDETKIRSYVNPLPSKCQFLSSRNMKPFKRWTYDEIHGCHYGLYKALLTPVHCQLTDDDNNNILKQTRSIFYYGFYYSTFILKSDLIHFKLLKVLDLRPIEIDRFPLEILCLIWLRYLAFSYPRNFDIPSEICKLWNLQTFIVNGYARSDVTFPEKIWGLMQLRHLEMDTFRLPNRPRGSVDKGRHWDFPNIQTISCLSPSCCTKEVISGIQNIKKLGIRGDKVDYESLRESGLLNNLVQLQQLETLSLQLYFRKLSVISSAKVFPETLKKLKLYGTNLSWSYLDIISELPNLEILKLMSNACYGGEWYPIARGFNRLKLLLVKNSDLLWKATNDNFPVLERLMLTHCLLLFEIPIEFADIHSLQLIELRDCLPELGESAARIQQEQEELGNNLVDVRTLRFLTALSQIQSVAADSIKQYYKIEGAALVIAVVKPRYAPHVVAYNSYRMSKFMSGVSESMLKECKTVMLIKEMDIPRLMVHSQQIEKAKNKEKERLNQEKVKFQWLDSFEKSLQELKTRLISAPVLTLPDDLDRWLELLKDYDMSIPYHLGKANIVADALSRFSMGSVAYVKNGKKKLVQEVHQIARLGVRLVDSGKGSVWV